MGFRNKLTGAGRGMPDEIIDTGREKISFRKLIYESLPEMWSFQILSTILLSVPTTLLSRLIRDIAESGGSALTSANLKGFILSWKAPAMLALFVVMIIIFVITEVFAQIHMAGNVLRGAPVNLRLLLLKGAVSMRKFLSPSGALTLLYIFIAAPLCGVGFTISLSESFYVPHFITDVIYANKLYAVAYIAAVIALAWLGYRSAFTLHFALLDGKSPSEARRESWRVVRNNRWQLIKGVVCDLLICALISALSFVIFSVLPMLTLQIWAKDLPMGYHIELESIMEHLLTDYDMTVLAYRILSAFIVIGGKYHSWIVNMLTGSYFIVSYTKRFLTLTGRGSDLWPARRKRSRYYKKVLLMVLVLAAILLASVIFAVVFEKLCYRDENVKVIAHRAGGNMASENSLEGLELAIEHGCYGSEIDVQRTKDGYYVINHDTTFQRVAGVNRPVRDMTLEEIQQLRIKDTTGTGALLPVPTFAEMLEIIKGREKLFVEMKGSTADRQMVDDLVKMIREAGCTEDCVLISLNYDIIDYAEKTYPEFETGTLFFLGIGDVSRLNCDMLIMEEETATDSRISTIHNAGKKAAVWTVNTEAGMKKFLKGYIDAIITDEIPLAEEVQEMLDERTDFNIISDFFD